MEAIAVNFTPNVPKIIEALLWIVDKRPGIDVYHVMKIMFAADCYHLSRFGRPVTGDYYVAVKYGVMPHIAKDIIDKKPWVMRDYGIDGLPIHREGHNLSTTRAHNPHKFSKSDLEALEYGFAEYADIPTFSAVREKNHRHPAWEKAAERQGYDITTEKYFDKLHQIIDFADMIDDEETLAELQELGSFTEQMIV
jgi:hypothetical protein